METGNRIKEARKKIGLTQKQLAQKLNVSQAMIGQYENGLRKPKFETILKIAEALEVPVDSLIESVSLGLMTEDDIKYFEYIQAFQENSPQTKLPESEVQSAYLPEETKKLIHFFEENPEYLKLLHASKNVKKKDIELVVQILERFNDNK